MMYLLLFIFFLSEAGLFEGVVCWQLPLLGLGNIVGIALGLSCFFAGIPTVSQYRTPSIVSYGAQNVLNKRQILL